MSPYTQTISIVKVNSELKLKTDSHLFVKSYTLMTLSQALWNIIKDILGQIASSNQGKFVCFLFIYILQMFVCQHDWKIGRRENWVMFLFRILLESISFPWVWYKLALNTKLLMFCMYGCILLQCLEVSWALNLITFIHIYCL